MLQLGLSAGSGIMQFVGARNQAAAMEQVARNNQTMAEYALILVGVAVIVAATAVLLGEAIDATFDSIIASL